MKTMTLVCRLAALGATLALAAIPGNAWQEFKGKFDLPVEARWGNVDLHPGRYRVSIYPTSGAPVIRLVSEDGGSALVLAMFREVRNVSHKSTLTLVQVDGNYCVRTLQAGDIGEVMTFRVSAHATPVLARNQKSEVRVPVARLGN